jgi:hypothetical protein
VLLVISRDPEGKEHDDFFFTTDLSLTPAQVIGGFAGRWSIEDTFKNTKQFVGGQEPQTWKRQGPERAAMLSLWLSSVVWLWYLREDGRSGKVRILPWYPQKAHPSFQDAWASLRRPPGSQRIISMFGKRFGHDKKTDVLWKPSQGPHDASRKVRKFHIFSHYSLFLRFHRIDFNDSDGRKMKMGSQAQSSGIRGCRRRPRWRASCRRRSSRNQPAVRMKVTRIADFNILRVAADQHRQAHHKHRQVDQGVRNAEVPLTHELGDVLDLGLLGGQGRQLAGAQERIVTGVAP